jgi:hypothetical protein
VDAAFFACGAGGLLTEAEIEASIRLLFEQHRSGSVQENHRVVRNNNAPRLCWWQQRRCMLEIKQ